MDYFGALQRTCTSGLWLLPRPRAFGEERVLFRAGGKNYTASMVGELLSDTGLEDQREVLEREIGQLDTWLGLEKGGLGVRTLCVISSGVKTLSSLVLDSPVEDLAANPRGASYTIEAEDGRVKAEVLRIVAGEHGGDVPIIRVDDLSCGTRSVRTTWEKVAPFVMLPPLYRLSIGAANIAATPAPLPGRPSLAPPSFRDTGEEMSDTSLKRLRTMRPR